MIVGYSNGFHDAGMAVINENKIIYAGHSERYSRVKNDKSHSNLMPQFSSHSTAFYEKPFKKNLRRFIYGQSWKQREVYDYYCDHHWSHAASAYYTRPFKEEPVCVVIDAIGEWDTASIWYKKRKRWSMKYPKSLGLFYSAATKAVGLKPMEDEYILMGMAAYGDPIHKFDPMINYHKGGVFKGRDVDVAASVQSVLEAEVMKIMKRARKYSEYLCYGGGVALNCVANSKVHHMFKQMWIMPNPGDCGSSLGAAAALNGQMLEWVDPYLGTNIDREVNPREVVDHLLEHSYCGIANGRAEFGPRALGNRSLIADPRKNIKDTVNQIKRRQKFRPFAPAILEEWADEYFSGPKNEYMQFVSTANHDFHSVTHVDGTARVQVVKKDCKSVIRPILEEWYERTNCPMLLNTSLNIKGKPMINIWEETKGFEKIHNVKIF